MDFEAQTLRAPRVLVPDLDEPILPSFGQDRGFLSDSLSVIAERLMEWGELADAALNEIGALGMMQWIEVGLLGDTHGLRSVPLLE